MSNLAAQGIPFLLLLVVTPVLLVALGRERYGALILFNLIPQIAGQLDLGFATAATRGFAHYSARGDRDAALRLFREAFVLLSLWGTVLAIAFYLSRATIARALKLDTIVDADSWIYLSAAIAIPVALANAATLVPLRALERMALTTYLLQSVITPVLFSGFGLVGRIGFAGLMATAALNSAWRSRT